MLPVFFLVLFTLVNVKLFGYHIVLTFSELLTNSSNLPAGSCGFAYVLSMSTSSLNNSVKLT